MHRHVWKITSQVTQPSAWEQMTAGSRTLRNVKLPEGGFDKPVIVTYRCFECGAGKVERV